MWLPAVLTAAHNVLKEEIDNPDIVINVIIGAYEYKTHKVGGPNDGVQTLPPSGPWDSPFLQATARDFIVPDEYNKALWKSDQMRWTYDVGVLILTFDGRIGKLVTPALLGEVLLSHFHHTPNLLLCLQSCLFEMKLAPCLTMASVNHGVTTIANQSRSSDSHC